MWPPRATEGNKTIVPLTNAVDRPCSVLMSLTPQEVCSPSQYPKLPAGGTLLFTVLHVSFRATSAHFSHWLTPKGPAHLHRHTWHTHSHSGLWHAAPLIVQLHSAHFSPHMNTGQHPEGVLARQIGAIICKHLFVSGGAFYKQAAAIGSIVVERGKSWRENNPNSWTLSREWTFRLSFVTNYPAKKLTSKRNTWHTVLCLWKQETLYLATLQPLQRASVKSLSQCICPADPLKNKGCWAGWAAHERRC